jgi:hypothetical protein
MIALVLFLFPLAYAPADGRTAWQVSSRYNQRSRADTQMGSWMTVFVPKMKASNFATQKAEVRIGTYILNKLTELRRPEFKLFV